MKLDIENHYKVINDFKVLQKEWYCINQFHSKLTEEEKVKLFKTRYDNFEGQAFKEFIQMSEIEYNEWQCWKLGMKNDWRHLGYNVEDFDEKENLTKVWKEFKDYWQYDTEETKQVFREMKLLSETLLDEWRKKYFIECPHVYEEYGYHHKEVEKRSKAQMWEEFKYKWDLDVDDYDEHILKELLELINECECDNSNYRKDYPRNFWEYRENANYHSYDSYSILEKYRIAEEWINYRDKFGYDSDN